MKQSLMLLFGMIVATMPILAQEALYPVPVNGVMGSMRMQAGAFIAEKPYEYKLTLGFPTDNQAGFLRDTKAQVVVLWCRIENLSQRPMALNTDNFTATDKDGRTLSRLAPDVAFDRIVAATGLTKKVLTKGLRGVSLGKAASKKDQDDEKDEAIRFSLQPGQIPALGMRQALIYFEAPEAKNFTVNISLGDLWSKPFIFTNAKPKK